MGVEDYLQLAERFRTYNQTGWDELVGGIVRELEGYNDTKTRAFNSKFSADGYLNWRVQESVRAAFDEGGIFLASLRGNDALSQDIQDLVDAAFTPGLKATFSDVYMPAIHAAIDIVNSNAGYKKFIHRRGEIAVTPSSRRQPGGAAANVALARLEQRRPGSKKPIGGGGQRRPARSASSSTSVIGPKKPSGVPAEPQATHSQEEEDLISAIIASQEEQDLRSAIIASLSGEPHFASGTPAMDEHEVGWLNHRAGVVINSGPSYDPRVRVVRRGEHDDAVARNGGGSRRLVPADSHAIRREFGGKSRRSASPGESHQTQATQREFGGESMSREQWEESLALEEAARISLSQRARGAERESAQSAAARAAVARSKQPPPGSKGRSKGAFGSPTEGCASTRVV